MVSKEYVYTTFTKCISYTRHIFTLLVTLLFSTLLFAQNTRLMLSDIGQYPQAHSLIDGIIVNHDSASQGILTYHLLQNNRALYTRTDSVNVPTGISDLGADSAQKTSITIPGKRFMTDSNYLLPGDYQVHYTFSISGHIVQEETIPIHVPEFDIHITSVNDSATIQINPPIKKYDWYVSVISQKQKNRRQLSKAITYRIKDTVVTQQHITDSVLLKKEPLYKFHVFMNGKLLLSSPYTTWNAIGKENREDLSDTALLKSNKLFHNNIVKVNGRAALEYRYSNIRFPNQYTSPQYLRFYFQPTVSVMGVPLTMNTLFSTENSSLYPVNTFNISFNANTFRKQFSQNALSYQLEKERSLQLNTSELKQLDKELIRQKVKLKQLKNNGDYSIDDLDTLQTGRVKKKRSYKKPGVKLPEDSLDISERDFSIRQHRMRQIDDLEMNINKLEEKKLKLQDALSKDSAFLRNRNWSANQNDTIQRFLKNQKYKGFTKTLLSMEKLDIGLTSPYYSSLTLAQTPMQGAHTEFTFNKWFVAATYGYGITSYPLLGIRTMSKPDFKRRIIGAKLGLGRKDFNSIYISYHHFTDDGTSSLNGNVLSAPKEDQILATGGTLRLVDQLRIEGELAKSFYVPDKNNSFENTSLSLNTLKQENKNTAFNIKAIGQLTPNTTLTGSLKQIGTGYYSIGVPFLRNDYREYELNWKQQYWFKQITTEVFYRDNRDNLSGNKTHTTVLKGYGAKLRTSFRRWPNLIASYQPFSMEATYKSNLFSTAALPELITQQFSVLSATIIYKKNIKKTNFYTTATYARSTNTDQTGYTSGLTTWIWNAQLTSPTNNQFTTTFSFTDPKPYLAQNKMYYGELGWGFPLIKNKLQNQVGYNGQWIADGKQRQGAYYQVALPFNKFKFTARAGFNFLKGNWGIPQETEQTVKALLEYFF